MIGTDAPVVAWLLAAYGVGAAIAVLTIDARGAARIGLALLWPLGPIAFVLTVSVLLAASLIAFPLVGALALAAAAVVYLFAR